MWRKVGLGIVAILCLVSSCIAVSDSEVLQFANGALAGSYYGGPTTSSISGNMLTLTGQLSEYSDMKVDTVGYKLWDLSSCAQKVIDQYPGRIKQVELKIFAANGQGPIGYASIAVN